MLDRNPLARPRVRGEDITPADARYGSGETLVITGMTSSR